MRILKFKKFNEAANGGDFLNGANPAPHFPSMQTDTSMKSLDNVTPDLIEGMDGIIYTSDKYDELYQNYGNNDPDLRIFNKLNLNTLLQKSNTEL
jgi:hypothetical protein